MNSSSSNSQLVNSGRHQQRSLCVDMLLMLLLSASTTKASTIVFSNLAASPQYYFSFGNWTGNFLPNTYALSAMNFTPSATGTLDELDLGYTNQKIVGTNAATLRLSPEVAGMPSAPIWTGTATAASIFGQLTSLTGIGGPMLTAGQTYWLEAFPPADGVTLHGWYTNNQGDLGSIIGSGNFVANTGRFALRVGVTTVPEPASLVLAAFGLMVTGYVTKPIRRGCGKGSVNASIRSQSVPFSTSNHETASARSPVNPQADEELSCKSSRVRRCLRSWLLTRCHR